MNLLVIIPGFGIDPRTPEKLRILKHNLSLLHHQFETHHDNSQTANLSESHLSIDLIPQSKFSVWMFVYDDTVMPSFVLDDPCVTVVRQPGLLGQFLIHYCHPDYVKFCGFTHVMTVLDDVEWIDVQLFDLLHIYQQHHTLIDTMQPSLQKDTVSLPYMKIQHHDDAYCGRALDVVEWFSSFMDWARYKLWHSVLSTQNYCMIGVPRVLYNLYGMHTVVIDKYKMKHWYGSTAEDEIRFKKNESFHGYLSHHTKHATKKVNLLGSIGNIMHYIPSTNHCKNDDMQQVSVKITCKLPSCLTMMNMVSKSIYHSFFQRLIQSNHIDSVENDQLTHVPTYDGKGLLLPNIDPDTSIFQLGSFDGVDACLIHKLLNTSQHALQRHLVVESNPYTLQSLNDAKEKTACGFDIVEAVLTLPSYLIHPLLDSIFTLTTSSLSASTTSTKPCIDTDRTIFERLLQQGIQQQAHHRDIIHTWPEFFQRHQLQHYNIIIMDNVLTLSFLIASIHIVLDDQGAFKDGEENIKLRESYHIIEHWLRHVKQIIVMYPLSTTIADPAVIHTPYLEVYLTTSLKQYGFSCHRDKFYSLYTLNHHE